MQKRQFAVVSMAKKFLHCCIGAHARVHVHFVRRVCMHSDRCFEHHACAGAYVKQVLCASAYTFAHTLAIGCAYALMHVQFIHSALKNVIVGALGTWADYTQGQILL